MQTDELAPHREILFGKSQRFNFSGKEASITALQSKKQDQKAAELLVEFLDPSHSADVIDDHRIMAINALMKMNVQHSLKVLGCYNLGQHRSPLLRTALRSCQRALGIIPEEKLPSAIPIPLLSQPLSEIAKPTPKVAGKKLANNQRDSISLDKYFTLGNAYKQEKKWEMAIEMYKKVLTWEPNHHQARFLLAICYRKMMKYQEALDHLRLVPSDHSLNLDAEREILEVQYLLEATRAAKKDKEKQKVR